MVHIKFQVVLTYANQLDMLCSELYSIYIHNMAFIANELFYHVSIETFFQRIILPIRASARNTTFCPVEYVFVACKNILKI